MLWLGNQMKIFLSWSGERSRSVATIFADWIRCVLQAADPWISSRDIDRGAVWFSEIGDQLNGVSMGIVFLTNENKQRPWILFESGALYKGLDTRVCTMLVDLQPADVQAPLGQFNHTLPTEVSMRLLVETLNSRLATPLEERVLEQVFATYWPQFEQRFADALAQTAGETPPVEARTEQNLLAEILENTRSLGKRIGAIEQRVAPGSVGIALPKGRGINASNKLWDAIVEGGRVKTDPGSSTATDIPGPDPS